MYLIVFTPDAPLDLFRVPHQLTPTADGVPLRHLRTLESKSLEFAPTDMVRLEPSQLEAEFWIPRQWVAMVVKAKPPGGPGFLSQWKSAVPVSAEATPPTSPQSDQAG